MQVTLWHCYGVSDFQLHKFNDKYKFTFVGKLIATIVHTCDIFLKSPRYKDHCATLELRVHYVCKFGSIQFQKQQERLADMFPLDKFLGRHVPG